MLVIDKVFKTEKVMRSVISNTLEALEASNSSFTFNHLRLLLEVDNQRIFFYTAPTLDKAYQRAGQVVHRVDIFEPLPTSVCCFLNARIRGYASV